MMSPQELETKRQELLVKRQEKQRRKRLRILFFASLLLVALALAAITAYYTFYRNLPGSPSTETTKQTAESEPERLNVVILGADEKPDDPGRTDTIMIASIDLAGQKVSVISVPRDTMVSIPGKTGKHRINSAHAFGGPELTVRTLSELLDVPLKYYAKINFEGFEKIVDTIGGVWIDVEKPMFYEDKAQNLEINLQAGRQKLSGKQALGYVRFRKDGLGDVALVDPNRQVYDGRVERQQKFVKALVKELMQAQNVVKLPALLGQLDNAVQTNIPYTAMLRLALKSKEIQDGKIDTAVLPGKAEMVNGASYWVSTQEERQLLVNRMILGKDTVTVEVLNGSGVSGVAGSVAQRLKEAGYDIVGVADANSYDYTKTKVMAKPHRVSAAESLAAMLQTGDITTESEIRANNVDITIIVGKDYRI